MTAALFERFAALLDMFARARAVHERLADGH
jgi:hypothetical protein